MNERAAGLSFDNIASSYDLWYKTALGRTYDVLEKKAIEKVLPAPANGDRLLEVGCGTGHWSAFFSRQGFVVTGVDISPKMVGAAREKGISDASFEVADAQSLPFEDGQFDVTAAITTLEFVRDPKVVVREMARCTRRPGGTIVVGVLNGLARINRERKAARKPPYDAAQLFIPSGLRELLAPYGEPNVASTTFVPASRLILPLASVIDAAGRLLHLSRGALLVGRVKL